MKRRIISFITAISLLIGLVGILPVSADYSMNEEQKTFTWDFAEFKVPLRGMTGNGFISTDYNGLTISIADQSRIDHDKIDENGVFWSGGKNNRRYISYKPKESGTLTVTGSDGTWGISASTYSSSATFLAEPASGVATLENCVAGTTYYIWSTTNGVTISKVEYTQSSGEMTDSSTVKYDASVEYSLIKGDEASTINTANSGKEYSIENNLISVKIAGTGSNNSKLSSSNGYDMYTDGYVLFTPDRDGKIVVEAVMRNSTSTLYMSTTGTTDGTSILASANATKVTGEIAVAANTSYYLYNTDTNNKPTSVKKITYTPKHQFYDDLTGADDSSSKTYTWHIGNHATAENKNIEVKQENNYANLTVSLGKSDFMADTSFCNGIKFNGASVGNSGSIADSGRYIFVEAKHSGTFNITMSFIDNSSLDNRMFYHDLTSDETFNASDYKKPSNGLSNGKVIQVAYLAQALSSNKDKEHIRPEEIAKLKVDMQAGHKYVLYTFQCASAVYEMSYQYTTDLAIDYKNEKLTGFVDGGDYTIGGETVTPENNELTIANDYFGKTLAIGGTLSGEELTQSLVVAARPAAPVADTDYTLTQPTVYGAKGSIKATVADTLEYKVGEGDWTTLTTEGVSVDQGSTVQIRKNATDSTFASEPTEQTINTIAQTFTVIWKNDSETLETDENVVDGAIPEYNGTTPTKEADAQYTYTFDGWTTEGDDETVYNTTAGEGVSAFETVTGNVTYTAHFSKALRGYTISWKNADGTDYITAQTLDYGSAVTAPEGTPVKDSTADNIYTFDKWTPEITADTKVTGDQTYTATFTESAREYNITYNLNGHGTAPTGNNLKYTAGTAKELPALTDDNYDFGGWYTDDTTFENAASITTDTRGNQVVYAKWTAKTYAVSAATGLANGSVSVNKTTASLNDEITVTITPNTGYQLASLTIGSAAVTGEALTNAVSSNSYTFTMPAKAVEVSATFEEIPVNTYTVTIICGDGIENVKLGTKTGSKDGNIYTFTEVEAGEYNFEVTYTEGYEKATVSPTSITVSESKTSETISAQKKKYTVTFKIEGWDDTEVQIEHGSTAQSQAPQNPTKSGYHFVGWVKGTDTTAAIITTWDAITSNGTIYTAKFEENAPDTVTVTFNAGDGTFDNAEKTKAVTINKGATLTANNLPSVTPPTGYTFNGWGDITGKAVNESVSYTAEYTIKSFTITWMLDESAKIDETTVDYNVLPTHADASKAATDEYTYTFKNWAPTIVVATENATYTAQFDSVKRKYTITWNIDGAETSEELEYGATPSHANPTKAEDANGKYSFTGWSPAIETVTKAQTYTAQFDTIAKYTITYNTDGGQINDDNYPRKYYAGEGVALPSDVTKDNYYFTGWYDNAEFNGEPVTSITASDNGNKEYWAQWTQGTPTEYLITFVNWDNTELQKSNVAVGVTPEYTGTTPTKAEDDRYTYEFIGWTPEIVTVSGIATYKAEFNQYVKPVNNAATIEKETDTNGIRLIVTPNDSTMNVINLYAAIYNANGSLKSVEMTPCTVSDNGKIIVPLTEPSLAGGESYKLMLWDIYQSPLITAITNSDSFFN